MIDENEDPNTPYDGETSQDLPQAAASPVGAAVPKVRVAPLQKLADLDAKRAEIIAEVRKQETRGKIIIGAAMISDAATDPEKVAYLEGLADKANDRDRIAIQTACSALFAKAAAAQAAARAAAQSQR